MESTTIICLLCCILYPSCHLSTVVSVQQGTDPDLSMEVADEQEERVCRVCRSGEEGGQLYRACRCSGSIGWIHEDCLKDWLSVSHGHRCELCKYQFRWQKGQQDLEMIGSMRIS